MTTHCKPSSSTRSHVSRSWKPRLSRRHLEPLLVSFFILCAGFALFRVVLNEGEDGMLALLAPIVIFIAVGSLFTGHETGRH